MAGNRSGGIKTAERVKELYGEDFYKRIGSKGGKLGKADGVVKGFAANKELARIAGSKGGKKSRRKSYRLPGFEGTISDLDKLTIRSGVGGTHNA